MCEMMEKRFSGWQNAERGEMRRMPLERCSNNAGLKLLSILECSFLVGQALLIHFKALRSS